jgi:lipoic acid synthetase
MGPIAAEGVPLRIPDWLKSGLPDAASLGAFARRVSDRGLNTICFEARCPNKRQCFEERAVTFLVMGRNCTRRCGFCNVSGADPEPLDADEPRRLGAAVSDLAIDHVIVTSVARDDLADGGSAHYEACAQALKRTDRPIAVEVLTPDFGGDAAAVDRVARSPIDVFAHNIETTERLYSTVRDKACYKRSLGVLEQVSRGTRSVVIKSGLMLGIGETLEEVRATIRHLREAGSDIVTVGQYMRPSKMHLPVKEYINPAVFDEIAGYARELGLVAVCGPRVRSSFRAGAAFHEAKSRRQRCA